MAAILVLGISLYRKPCRLHDIMSEWSGGDGRVNKETWDNVRRKFKGSVFIRYKKQDIIIIIISGFLIVKRIPKQILIHLFFHVRIAIAYCILFYVMN